MRHEFFETIKVIDGVHHNLDYHQARYEGVLKTFGATSYEKIESLLDAPKKGLFRCRIVYGLDALNSIEYIEYTKREVRSLKLIQNDTLEYKYKSTSREALDALYTRKQDCDDVLVVQKGFVTDTTIANIALLQNGVWYTPKNVLLQGTTRARYLEENKIILRDISVNTLGDYESIALLNAMVDFDIIPLNKGDFFVK